MTSLLIRISGQVQGLGFRPYVYRLAQAMGIRGTVGNSLAGLEILAQGPRARAFCRELQNRPPALAEITGFSVRTVDAPACPDFRIVRSLRRTACPGVSRAPGRATVSALPDIATCPDCGRELFRPTDRRFGYPFTNCTQCGPRYSIILSLPYDRPRTTMAGFRMCPDCAREYSAPADRRFHAQPNACPVCGPQVTLRDARGVPVRTPDPVREAARALAAGKLVAVRSLGGFQLACDARNPAAVRRLRRLKRRPTKPLALMVEDIAAARSLCRLSRAGRKLLLSPAAPIVLLPLRPAGAGAVATLAAPGNDRLGLMLAFTPLHLLLFARLKEEMARRAGTGTGSHRTAKSSGGRRIPGRGPDAPPPVLVMTSANRRDEPVLAEDEELIRDLAGVFDLVLTHDRPIANPCDDSVVLPDDPPVPVRRARGYAPRPVRLGPMFHVKHPTLALGGESRNCFCLAAGEEAWLSPHLGRLDSARAERRLRATLERYQDWTGIRPTRLACDLHPDYASTRLAERLSRDLGLPLFRVQHHYAHALSGLVGTAAESERQPVLALCFDGTGYGTDQAVWGCEFLVVWPDRTWLRAGQLRYLRLTDAGAELADPARVAAAYLRQAQGGNLRSDRGPLCSSLGRLFDAFAAISGVKRNASFEGEAAVALEAALTGRPAAGPGYRFPCASGPKAGSAHDRKHPIIIDPAPALLAAAADARAGVPAGEISARFHSGFTRAAVRTARRLASAHGIRRVLLTGGSFQNSYLRSHISRRLRAAGLTAGHSPLVPVNDGGLSLGQAVAAASAP